MEQEGQEVYQMEENTKEKENHENDEGELKEGTSPPAVRCADGNLDAPPLEPLEERPQVPRLLYLHVLRGVLPGTVQHLGGG